MIVKVKIDEQVYEVEINNLHRRPIIAIVEGDEFEVWPEGEPAIHTIDNEDRHGKVKPNTSLTGEALSKPLLESTPATGVKIQDVNQSKSGNDSLLVVRAPIPGVITAINTQAGADVVVGQQLCVLEAMKMNNSIRASRAGKIAAVKVTVGQHVKHHDILLEYTS
jgi:glutaconyl-CoA/methylmalonyl-CoA decarboxylase subunit gamma